VLLVDETVASQGLGKTPPPKFVITGSGVRIPQPAPFKFMKYR
jgi:hypothetical protein